MTRHPSMMKPPAFVEGGMKGIFLATLLVSRLLVIKGIFLATLLVSRLLVSHLKITARLVVQIVIVDT
jgi:hypothetical protein